MTLSKLAGCALLGCALLGCALPGRQYEVSPALTGSLHGPDGPDAGARVLLSVHYPDNPVLGARHETRADRNGRFAFAPVTFSVAGLERGKRYRLFLDLLGDDETRVLWRGSYRRSELGLPVQLDCDLSRTPSQGQVCWVENGTLQPWLLRAGRSDFLRLCADCHGREGIGDGPASMAQGAVPPDLTAIAQRRGGVFPRGEIAEWIDGRLAPPVHGTRSMPAWGEPFERDYARYEDADELAGARIDTLVIFLESLQQQK